MTILCILDVWQLTTKNEGSICTAFNNFVGAYKFKVDTKMDVVTLPDWWTRGGRVRYATAISTARTCVARSDKPSQTSDCACAVKRHKMSSQASSVSTNKWKGTTAMQTDNILGVTEACQKLSFVFRGSLSSRDLSTQLLTYDSWPCQVMSCCEFHSTWDVNHSVSCSRCWILAVFCKKKKKKKITAEIVYVYS